MSSTFIQFLHDRSAAGVAHVTGSLLDHLEGTARILREWGSPAHLCDAGLAHAVYGTSGFPLALLDVRTERSTLVGLIGAEAEHLVYLYGACDRERVYPQIGVERQVRMHDRFDGRVYSLEPRQLAELMELTFANELEIAAADAAQADAVERAYGALFRRSRGLVSASASATFERLCGAARIGA
jgi:hypothetical protein